MKNRFKEIKIMIERELICVNLFISLTVAVICAVIGLIFLINGIDKEICEHLVMPKTAPSLFCVGLLGFVSLFLYGFSASVFAQSKCCNGKRKNGSLLLAVCTLILMYALVPLVYGSSMFFLSLMLSAVIITGQTLLLRCYYQVNRIAFITLLISSLWNLYLTAVIAGLFVLN